MPNFGCRCICMNNYQYLFGSVPALVASRGASRSGRCAPSPPTAHKALSLSFFLSAWFSIISRPMALRSCSLPSARCQLCPRYQPVEGIPAAAELGGDVESSRSTCCPSPELPRRSYRAHRTSSRSALRWPADAAPQVFSFRRFGRPLLLSLSVSRLLCLFWLDLSLFPSAFLVSFLFGRFLALMLLSLCLWHYCSSPHALLVCFDRLFSPPHLSAPPSRVASACEATGTTPCGRRTRATSSSSRPLAPSAGAGPPVTRRPGAWAPRPDEGPSPAGPSPRRALTLLRSSPFRRREPPRRHFSSREGPQAQNRSTRHLV